MDPEYTPEEQAKILSNVLAVLHIMFVESLMRQKYSGNSIREIQLILNDLEKVASSYEMEHHEMRAVRHEMTMVNNDSLDKKLNMSNRFTTAEQITILSDQLTILQVKRFEAMVNKKYYLHFIHAMKIILNKLEQLLEPEEKSLKSADVFKPAHDQMKQLFQDYVFIHYTSHPDIIKYTEGLVSECY